MRPALIAILALATLLVAHVCHAKPPPLPSPFGIRLGSTYHTHSLPASEELGRKTYSLSDVPNPIPELQKYTIVVDFDSKIDSVKGYSRFRDPQKYQSAIDSLHKKLSSIYGKSKSFDSPFYDLTRHWEGQGFLVILNGKNQREIELEFSVNEYAGGH